jgi:hypothetical protein
MKCCGLPTVPSAADAPPAQPAAADALQAIVFGEILKPLSAALGPVGDIAVEALSQQLFMRPRR